MRIALIEANLPVAMHSMLKHNCNCSCCWPGLNIDSSHGLTYGLTLTKDEVGNLAEASTGGLTHGAADWDHNKRGTAQHNTGRDSSRTWHVIHHPALRMVCAHVVFTECIVQTKLE
jgi:hypothetical protein